MTMKKGIFIIAAFLLVLPGLAQSRNCLRVMPTDELTQNATYIARVKVVKCAKANHRGLFGQVARLEPVDVISGDSSLREINVAAQAKVQCAADSYAEGQEMLVFLDPEGSLLKTVNYQYGQFLVVGDVVKGWRGKDNHISDRPYAEVKQEIDSMLVEQPPQAPEKPATQPAPARPQP